MVDQIRHLPEGVQVKKSIERFDVPMGKGQPGTLGINHPLRKSLGDMRIIGRLVGVPGKRICPCR